MPDYPFPESTGGAIVEWGVMRNLGPRNAIGVSWFFAFNGDGLSTGPTMRYRRWLKGGRSLDFGVGTPINFARGPRRRRSLGSHTGESSGLSRRSDLREQAAGSYLP